MPQSPWPRNSYFGFLISLLTLLSFVNLAQPPDAWASGKYKVLYSFKGGIDGDWPWDKLVFDVAGNLYGATLGGGTLGRGTVFRLIPNSNGKWTESVLHSFDEIDGAGPHGALIFDGTGSVYGTTLFSIGSDGGTAFALMPSLSSGWTFSLVYTFCTQGNCTDGYAPLPAMVWDEAGDLYGFTGGGGTNGDGAFFKLTPGSPGWTENVLYNFCPQSNCDDGRGPVGGPIWGSDGDLYGTTTFGGKSTFPCDGRGCGVVFRLKHHPGAEWTYEVLHKFTARDGAFPVGLAIDPQGSLYTATTDGGAFGYGTAFKLTPTSKGWKATVLYNFRSHANLDPLVFDAAGNLYGTTYDGGIGTCQGDRGCGEVYKLTPGGRYGRWTYRTLHPFTGGQDGGFPQGGVIVDGNGNIYGTAATYGRKGHGVVFEITP